mgnify:CR=1 FL=1
MHQSILTYGEFVTYIRENVEAVLNEDREAEVVLTEVEKNNGVMSEIMTIRQERENFAPVFYMRDIFGEFHRMTWQSRWSASVGSRRQTVCR